MAYSPTLDDIPQTAGYTPSLSDISEIGQQSSSNPIVSGLNAIGNQTTKEIPDLLAGEANVGHYILNAPSNTANWLAARGVIPQGIAGAIPRQQDYNFSQMVGVDNPNILDKAIQAAPMMAGMVGGGELAGLAKAPGFIGDLTANASPLTQTLANAFGMAGKNALFGAGTNVAGGGSATMGGLAGGAGGMLGAAINDATPILSQPGNTVLAYLNNSAKNNSALSPAETADNIAKNYSDLQGNSLNVDIGRATNNPALQGLYNNLKYVPFSGVSKNINTINKQLSDNELAGLQNQLQANTALTDPINTQLQTLGQQQNRIENAINQTPDFLNRLGAGLGDPANLTSDLKQSTANIFNANRATAANNYEPINNSTLRFDNGENINLFPNYASATNELLANRENMLNLFDKDSDLSSALRNEIDKAQGVINNSNDYGITLPEAVSRMQNLGKLQASANSQGRRYEGMLLGQLKDGLSTDVNNNLVNSGNSDLADQLQTANNYYKNNVIPFYQNNNIRKAVTSDYIPPKATLANALHDPNSQSILTQMPQEAQNAALYQMITGGKGNSAGVSNMNAQQIGNSYAKLPVDTKTAVAQYNPLADQHFENLPNYINQNNDLLAKQSDLTNQLNTINNNTQDLQNKINAATQKRYGATGENSASADKIAKIAATAGTLTLGAFSHALGGMVGGLAVPGILASRQIAKTLTNPDVINAYVNGTKLPSATPIIGNKILGGIAGIPATVNNQ